VTVVGKQLKKNLLLLSREKQMSESIRYESAERVQ
jgi:hypothetical protein